VRRVLLVAVTMAAGPVLLSCSEPRLSADESPTNSPLAYEPPGPVARAPLLPPAGYASTFRNCQRFQSSLSRSAVGWSQKWRELSVATTDEGDRRKAAIPHV
jgi:hypothetical protein